VHESLVGTGRASSALQRNCLLLGVLQTAREGGPSPVIDPTENKVAGDPWLLLRLRKVSPTLKLVPSSGLGTASARGDVNSIQKQVLSCRGEARGTPAWRFRMMVIDIQTIRDGKIAKTITWRTG